MFSCDFGGITALSRLTPGWTKYNWDTGAGVSAFKKGEKDVAVEQGAYCTASGEYIDDYGSQVHYGQSEDGQNRKLRGRAVNVHKNLVSASQSCGYNDAYLWSDGGVLIPKNSTFAIKMRQYYDNLLWELGEQEHMHLVQENGVYNF